jgi:hypothetical protein
MVDIQTVSVVITAVSIVFRIGMGIVQFRNLVKTRQIQQYLDLYHRLCEKDLHRYANEVLLLWTFEDDDDFFAKYGPDTNLDEWLKWTLFTPYLENMGLVLHAGLVDVQFAANLIGSMIQNFWEKYAPILRAMQRRWNTPRIMPMTEYLYEHVKRVRPRYT